MHEHSSAPSLSGKSFDCDLFKFPLTAAVVSVFHIRTRVISLDGDEEICSVFSSMDGQKLPLLPFFLK